MELFFANIGYVISISMLLLAARLMFTKDMSRAPLILAICAFVGVAWLPYFWQDPHNMAEAHTAIVLWSMILIMGKYSNRIILVFLAALGADILWLYFLDANMQENSYNFPYSLFYWQSFLNLLSITLCFLVALRCYNPPINTGEASEKFMARNNHKNGRPA